jgi:predicted 2-oxoglutarate/Fe(II)-dependent dioxygenase YbiX
MSQDEDWPRCCPKEIGKFSDSSILAGYEDAIWRALAHVDPREFDREKDNVTGRDKGQQIPIRAALRSIGLGWVASNNVAVRKVCFALFRAAKAAHERNNWKQFLKPPQLHRIDIEEKWLQAEDAMNFVVVKQGCTSKECIFPSDVVERINASIQETGMCLIRNAVDKPTIQKLRLGESDPSGCHPRATKIKEANNKTRRITELSGAGLGGEESLTSQTKKLLSSYYVDASSDFLNLLQDIIISSLKGEQKIIESSKYRKSILLKYSKGSENFAHADGNNGNWFSYQALLMLSESDEYDGGEFYVAKRDGEKIVRTCCPKLNAGDLVVFQAGSGKHFQGQKYFHGMKQITKGERVVVGLLQLISGKEHSEEKNPGKETKKRKKA